MEFVFRVIFILFIGLVVGTVIISFTKTTVQDAQRDIEQFDPGSVEERFRQVKSITAEEIAMLAKKCIEAGSSEPDIGTCYALRSEDDLPTGSEITAAWAATGYPGEVDVNGCSSSKTALFMGYIIPDTAEITCKG